MQQPHEVSFIFGQFTFSLFCQDGRVIKFLKSHYETFLSNSPSDVSVIIKLSLSKESKAVTIGQRYTYTILKEKFNFGPNLIEGSWDPNKRICYLIAAESVFKPEEIWLFDRFLCRIFYTLSLEEKIRRKDEIIIHGTGVLKDKKGYLFFGPPESGKSTVAHLSRKFRVLHDDMILVTLNGNVAQIEGVPFNPKVVERRNGRGTLSKIFSLHKSNQVKVEKGTPEEFTQRVLPEIFLPQPLLSEDRKKAFQYMLSFVVKLGKIVPYYCLYFKKDESFWALIEDMEDDNGRN
jgi:hypothetical protein